MKFDLRETAKAHRIIVCHRGVTGGNIPCNTLPAYKIALMEGTHMLETDVSTTGDGELVIFHPRMEKDQLGAPDCDISKMPWSEVKELRYTNADNRPTQFGLLKLDEFLEEFKGKCYINIDKFWGNPAGIYKAVKRHDMVDQVLVKSHLNEEVIRVLEEVGPEIPFMPVVYEEVPAQLAELKGRNINYVGVEVVFEREDSELCSEKFLDKLRADGKLTWVNSLIYNTKKQLSGGHSDDTAFTVSMDYGWGWLAQKNFDMIQTDWPGHLIRYLKSTGQFYRE
jgi:glycerophosphoryl diester phosphodiesterase